MRILEICAGDLESVNAAVAGGAQRIELCSSLAEGGITPSIGFIAMARRITREAGVRLHVLIRPRGGDFLYTPEEVACMAVDITSIREGDLADGVVTGCLDRDGNVDMEACRQLMTAAGNLSVTFHRAFDRVADPAKALEEVIALGCDRILTSGLASSAFEGREMLRRIRENAAGRIGIIAAAGVSPENAAGIIAASGVGEIHASARSLQPSKMRTAGSGVAMGASDSDTRLVTSADIVAGIIKEIQ